MLNLFAKAPFRFISWPRLFLKRSARAKGHPAAAGELRQGVGGQTPGPAWGAQGAVTGDASSVGHRTVTKIPPKTAPQLFS